jgi:hypothetical protein
VKFYTSPDGSVWTQLGTTRSAGAFTTTVRDTTDALEIGTHHAGTSEQASGKFYRAQIYASVDGTALAFDADFGSAAEPFATFAESSANAAVVTINRSSSGRKSTVVDRDAYLLTTDNYLEIADAPDLNFTLTDSFTVAVLCRLHGTTGNQVLLAKKINRTTGTGYELDRGTSDAANFILADGTNTVTATAGALAQGVATLLAGVRSVAADNTQAFKDATGGTAASDGTADTLLNTEVLRIGRLSGAGTNQADMVFLGAAVLPWALSAAELAQLKTELMA